ncbi:MAG: cytochrome ubiquinol oxidase subunit I [Gemmatimonadaceae bacterium]|nr:cytochrome ubiquinol oxidase subunit I [Gemmatimonadaceae bacterium]
MPDLLAARSQMAMSLAFHIIFAMLGIGMPLLMVVAEWRHLRTNDPVYLDLAKRWAKGTAILFAVGAVSGTVLSLELGLLWPGFMKFAGAIIGMPFSLEGFAFFTEAIFLGVYLYGWNRISPRAHLAAGMLVALSGVLSGIFVVIANAWMNAPRGFVLKDGVPVDIDPIAALMTPAAFPQALHMTLAAYASTGFAVAGVHAFMLLRQRRVTFHRYALGIALAMAVPASLLQPISGDIAAKFVATSQPAKLAAMEGQFTTERGAPLRIGGWPDEARRETRFAFEIPKAFSLLAFGDPNAEVKGLDQVPREDWPPVAIVHVAFQLMVAMGSYMALLSLWIVWLRLRRRPIPDRRRLLWAVVIASPMGFLATEAGWVVTEVGRQPWIVQGVLRTADAVTPMPGLVVPFLFFTALYLFLGVIVVYLLYHQIVGAPVSTRRLTTVANSATPEVTGEGGATSG